MIAHQLHATSQGLGSSCPWCTDSSSGWQARHAACAQCHWLACQHTGSCTVTASSLPCSTPLHCITAPAACTYPAVCVRLHCAGHVAAVLPWPYLLLDCRQRGGSLALMPPPAALQQEQQCTCSSTDPTCSVSTEADSSSSSGAIGSSRESCSEGGLLWLVPTGNLDHQVLVSWGTLLVTAACCLAVSWTALSSTRGQP